MPNFASNDECSDVWLDLWLQKKSIKPSTKFQKSSTYRQTKRRDRDMYNSQCLIVELCAVPYAMCDYIRENIENHGLLLRQNIRQSVPGTKNDETNGVVYSMNKKNRWLLQGRLHERVKDIPLQITDKNTKSDQEPPVNQVSVIGIEISNKQKGRTIAYVQSKKYFDNSGNSFENPTNATGLLGQWSENHHVRRHRPTSNSRRRLLGLRKRPNRRIAFKNGNRDRNSGLKRRNEVSPSKPEHEQIRPMHMRDKLIYQFFTPDTIMKSKRCIYRQPKHFFTCRDGNYLRMTSQLKIKESRRDLKYELSSLSMSPFGTQFFEEDHVEENTDDTKFEHLIPLDRFIRHGSSDKMPIVRPLTKPRRHAESVEKRRHVLMLDAKRNNTIVVNPSDGHIVHNKKLIGIQVEVENLIYDAETLLVSKYELRLIHECNPAKLIIDISRSCGYCVDDNMSRVYLVLDCPLVRTGLVHVKVNISSDRVRNEWNTIADCLSSKFLDCMRVTRLSFIIDTIVATLVGLLKTYDLKANMSKSTQSSMNVDTSNLLGNMSFAEQSDLYKTYANQITSSHTKRKPVCNKMLMDPIRPDGTMQITEQSVKLCDICYDEHIWPSEYITISDCDHTACLDCWKAYISTKINTMKTSGSFEKDNGKDTKLITCIQDQCGFVLTIDLLLAIVNIDQVNNYLKFYVDLRIANAGNYVYCPNRQCNKLVIVHDKHVPVCVCQCGFMVCTYCKKEAHFPAKCNQIETYANEIKNIENLLLDSKEIKLYTSEGKMCPKCGNYMEKDGGCNHMSCICGFQYCWSCMKSFYEYHTAETGYACVKGSADKDLVRFDSSAFMNKTTNLKRQLYMIMAEQRDLRSSIKWNRQRNMNAKRLTKSLCGQLCKIKTSTNRSRKKVEPDQTSFMEDIQKSLENMTDYSDVREYFDKKLRKILNHLGQLYFINEYLALLLNDRKSSTVSKHSFKSNLHYSLKKSIILCKSISEILESGKTLSDYLKLENYNAQIIRFVRNLRHLTIDYLHLYEQ